MINSGIRVTPNSVRHASIGSGSMPVSTTIAVPGSPVDRTNASPCPTSQATISHPVGGQPLNIVRTGEVLATNAKTSTPTTTNRPHRRRANHMPANNSAAKTRAANHPRGHETCPTGTAAP